MKNIRFWLHWLLVTALAAALYPFPVLLRVWSNGAQWTAPVMTAALAGCAWLGMLYILLLRRQYARHPKWINGGVWAITLLLCVAGCLFAPYPARLDSGRRLLFRQCTAGISPAGASGTPECICGAVPVGLLHRIPVIP